MSTTITTPVGRLVEGSLYRFNDKDANGNLLTYKSGPKKGEPRVEYYFAVAIPKGSEATWSHTEWGTIIHNVGKLAFPQGQWQRPTFAWKITDGDSTVPNNKSKRPCDKEGFARSWILRFSSGFAPKIHNADGSQLLTEVNHVNLGDFVQVYADVVSNKSDQQPGIHLNHRMVAFSGFGERIISSGVDATAVGFGQAPLPLGASTTPKAALDVAPYPQILMTPKAGGMTYDQYKNAGWTDEQMRANGVMV